MSRLIRMDQTGHTTLAEWTADDSASGRGGGRRVPRASSIRATSPSSPRARDRPSRSRELPLDAPLVILRRPIAGG